APASGCCDARSRGRPWGERAMIRRTLGTVVVAALALLLASWILPGFTVDGVGAAVLAVVVAALLNALLWPLPIRVTLPLTVATIGFGALLLNGLVLLAVAAIVPGVTIDSVLDAVLAIVLVTVLTSIAASLVSIDDEDRFRGHLSRRPKPRDAI